MSKVWVVSRWLSRSSFDNEVLGVFSSEEKGLQFARAQIDRHQLDDYEQITKGYYEEAVGYDHGIISVNCAEIDAVDESDQRLLDSFSREAEEEIIKYENGSV